MNVPHLQEQLQQCPAWQQAGPARLWNHLLGGKDHDRADAHIATLIKQFVPTIPDAALHARAFLARAIHHLSADTGIRQFLDLGAGLPTIDNTHELAQRAAPTARTVYVDHNPLVMATARALLTSTPPQAVSYIQADLRDPATILREAAGTLDLARPVAVLLLNVLEQVDDDREAERAVGHLVSGLVPGSHLVIAHLCDELHGDGMHQALRHLTDHYRTSMTARDRDQVRRLVGHLSFLDPGIVATS